MHECTSLEDRSEEKLLSTQIEKAPVNWTAGITEALPKTQHSNSERSISAVVWPKPSPPLSLPLLQVHTNKEQRQQQVH